MSDGGMSFGMTVDAAGVRRMMDALSPDEAAAATRTAFRRTAGALRRSVQSAYRARFPGSVLYKAVHSAAWRTGKGATVDIYPAWQHYGKGDPLYKSYILPMLEQGNYLTSPRKRNVRLRDGSTRQVTAGDIRASRFYRRGVDSGRQSAMSDLQRNIERAFMNKIEKLARR